jgi:membrane protease YdiL (CAAX protease family)
MRAVIGTGLGLAVFTVLARRLPQPRPPDPERGRVLFAAAVAATTEELLWRGFLLAEVRRRAGAVAALAVTSAGFTAAHGRRASRAHVLLGSVLGAVALEPGGLRAAVSAHIAYDVLVLLEEPP